MKTHAGLCLTFLLLALLFGGTQGTASSSARISAHLTQTSFTAAKASSATLTYRLSKKNTRFSYRLSFRKKDLSWRLVKAVKKGSSKGTYKMTVKKLFAGKPIHVGYYWLKLQTDTGRANLLFDVVKPLSNASQISAGDVHTCALISGGTVKCWGDNSFRQLGNGNTTMLEGSTPVPISGIPNATQISAGGEHTCALISGGTVKCWGDNDNSPPVEVSGITNATQISAGGTHTCALISGGTIKCWGYNYWGQLGNGTTDNSPTPVEVSPVEVSGITNATQISSGGVHTCALISGGTIKCWGYNFFGALGNDTTTSSSTPVEVSGITNATQISAGGVHTCALLPGGTIKCWGWNISGELGDGTTTDSSTPVPVSGITNATQISAGDAHACALFPGGTIKCWGDNGTGQLGNDTTTNSSTPVEVVGFF